MPPITLQDEEEEEEEVWASELDDDDVPYEAIDPSVVAQMNSKAAIQQQAAAASGGKGEGVVVDDKQLQLRLAYLVQVSDDGGDGVVVVGRHSFHQSVVVFQWRCFVMIAVVVVVSSYRGVSILTVSPPTPPYPSSSFFRPSPLFRRFPQACCRLCPCLLGLDSTSHTTWDSS
jgi:hypothetical protein